MGRLSGARRTAKRRRRVTVQTVKPTFDCQRACAVSQETRDSELAFGQHGRSWTRTAGSSDTSGSPFPPLLSLWITPHQLHKTHFHIKKSPLTLAERLTGRKEPREVLRKFTQECRVTGTLLVVEEEPSSTTEAADGAPALVAWEEAGLTVCVRRVRRARGFEGGGVSTRLQLWACPLPTGGHPPPFLLSVPELMFFKVLKLVYVPSFNEIVFVKKFCSLLSYDVQNPSQRPTVGMR